MFKTFAPLALAALLAGCAAPAPAPENASGGSSFEAVGASDTYAGRVMRAECRGLKGPSYDVCMRRGADQW